jgi:hypothetical protein
MMGSMMTAMISASLLLGQAVVGTEKKPAVQIDGKIFHWIEVATSDMRPGQDWSLYKIEVTEGSTTVEVAFRVPAPEGARVRGSPGGMQNPNFVVTINKADGRVLDRTFER